MELNEIQSNNIVNESTRLLLKSNDSTSSKFCWDRNSQRNPCDCINGFICASSIPSNHIQTQFALNQRISEDTIPPLSREYGENIGQSFVYFFHPSKSLMRFNLYDYSSVSNNPERLKNYKLKAQISRPSVIIIQTMPDYDTWCHIFVGNISGYAIVDFNRINNDSYHFKRLNQVYRYQIWQGNNVFCCNGLMMFGSDGKFFIATNLLVLITGLMFICNICINLMFISEELRRCILLFFIGLFCFCVISLWQTALIEPGIIPRNPPNAIVNHPIEVEHDWKYCEICNIYMPPR